MEWSGVRKRPWTEETSGWNGVERGEKNEEERGLDGMKWAGRKWNRMK